MATRRRDVDLAIVGGGIVGLATALSAAPGARPDLRIAVIEKEAELATHQSGHNSGVLHAGLYYAPGSLKATLCREGKAELERFAEAHDIPIEHCGKLVVALDEGELPRFAALKERAVANGVPGLEEVGRERIARARAARRRDPGAVEPVHRDHRLPPRRPRPRRRDPVAGRRDPPRASGHRHPRDDRRASSSRRRCGALVARHVIVCAGLQADRLATMAGATGCAADRPVPRRLLHADARTPAISPAA